MRSWPTATAQDAVGARNETSTRPEGSKHNSGTTLTDEALRDQVSDGKVATQARLNPRFVEWLMGFPECWTEPFATAPIDSAPSGTPSSPPREPLPSSSSGTDSTEVRK